MLEKPEDVKEATKNLPWGLMANAVSSPRLVPKVCTGVGVPVSLFTLHSDPPWTEVHAIFAQSLTSHKSPVRGLMAISRKLKVPITPISVTIPEIGFTVER